MSNTTPKGPSEFSGPAAVSDPSNQGTYQLPWEGTNIVTASPPGGTPTGSVIKNKDGGIYKGLFVAPVGGSGITVSKPKPFKRG